VFEKASEKDRPVRAVAGHWHKVDGKWKFVRDVATSEHSSKNNPSVIRENLYLTVMNENYRRHRQNRQKEHRDRTWT